MKLAMKLSIVVATLVGVAYAHREYMRKIPNGDKVPNPCGEGVWQAVGHNSPDGHHGINKFGEDFKHEGHKGWTKELCQMDSDGDGKTNGVELGDPHCTWAEGKTPEKVTDLSDPAICDPVHSSRCHDPCHGIHS